MCIPAPEFKLNPIPSNYNTNFNIKIIAYVKYIIGNNTQAHFAYSR